jgi:hypothetical protein
MFKISSAGPRAASRAVATAAKTAPAVFPLAVTGRRNYHEKDMFAITFVLSFI